MLLAVLITGFWNISRMVFCHAMDSVIDFGVEVTVFKMSLVFKKKRKESSHGCVCL